MLVTFPIYEDDHFAIGKYTILSCHVFDILEYINKHLHHMRLQIVRAHYKYSSLRKISRIQVCLYYYVCFSFLSPNYLGLILRLLFKI